MKKKFYAYYINENTFGVVDAWPMCQTICKGLNAKYKSFENESLANEWLDSGCEATKKGGKVYACHFVDSGINKIYTSWEQCKKAVADKKARYKSFKNEKEANDWLNKGALYENKEEIKRTLEEAIYFDAGTGRGIGVEARVTDKFGNSLLKEAVPQEKVNEHGNYLCKEGLSNNFGELMGCYIALKIALEKNEKKIFGDSRLIIEYWSKGHGKLKELNEDTVKLITMVKKLRGKFEENGGELKHISGDYNPADLGFHK